MDITIEQVEGTFWVGKVSTLGPSLVGVLQEESGNFWSVSTSNEEISVVSRVSQHVSFTDVEGPWLAFRISGELDFALVGILSRCSSLLANAGISVFAVSTFTTDYFLVKSEVAREALAAWQDGGIVVQPVA